MKSSEHEHLNHTVKSNFCVARLKNNWKLGLNARSRNGRPLKWHIWKKRGRFRAENDPFADSFTPEALQPAFRGGLSTVLSSVEDRLASREQSRGGERVSVNKYASRYFNGGNNFRRAINQPLQPGTREWRTLRDSFFFGAHPPPPTERLTKREWLANQFSCSSRQMRPGIVHASAPERNRLKRVKLIYGGKIATTRGLCFAPLRF